MDRDNRLVAEINEGLAAADRTLALAYQKLSAIADNEKRRIARQRLKALIEKLMTSHNVKCLRPGKGN